MSRIVCNFSCGAASAVATKIAIAEHSGKSEVAVVNAFVKEEHDDNRRFLADCQQWFEQPIVQLRDEKYSASAVEVFQRVRFLKGRRGAPCSRRLKRDLLDGWSQPGDVIVLGMTVEEQDRFEDFQERNPGRPAIAPLIDRGLTKDDCKAMVSRAGLDLPAMYQMGYENANCIGCVKGGEGYWRAIREDFPDQFKAVADIEQDLRPGAFLFRDRKTNVRFSLHELGDGPIRRNEAIPSCSFFCEMAEHEYSA